MLASTSILLFRGNNVNIAWKNLSSMNDGKCYGIICYGISIGSMSFHKNFLFSYKKRRVIKKQRGKSPAKWLCQGKQGGDKSPPLFWFIFLLNCRQGALKTNTGRALCHDPYRGFLGNLQGSLRKSMQGFLRRSQP